MKKSILFLTAAGLLAFAACKKDDKNPGPSTGPTAKAMFFHGVLNGGDSIRVKINDTVQNSVAALQYLKSSNYQNVRAGNTVKATFYFNNTGATLAETTQGMTANTNYSYFAGGLVTTPYVVSSQDDLSAPASGKAKVRFVNLSPDNMNVDCYVGATVDSKVQAAVPYKTVTAFKDVNAGSNLTIQMNDKDVITLKGELPNQTLLAGKIYTYVLTGTAAGSGSAALKLTSITNN